MNQDRATLDALNAQAEPIFDNPSDQDHLTYKDRWMAFGEEAALRWLNCYSRPAMTNIPDSGWQANTSMFANHGSTVQRNIPDVAMAADNIWDLLQ